MAVSTRKVMESPLYHAAGTVESIAYTFDWTSASGTAIPASPIVTLEDMTGGTYCSLSGTAVISGYYVTTQPVTGLERNHKYRLTCSVTIGLNVLSSYCDLIGE